MAIQRTVLAFAVGFVTLAAHAGGSITSGTTTLQFTGTPFASGSGNANLMFLNTTNFGADNLFRMGWAYNQGVGTNNRAFSSITSPTESYAGNAATFAWTDAGAGAASFARFNATMKVEVVEISPGVVTGVPGSARVNTTLTFTAAANNAAPVSYNLFHLLDLDVGTSADISKSPGDTYKVTAANTGFITGRVTDANYATKPYAEFQANEASRYEFNTGTALRSKIGDATGSSANANLSTLASVTASDWSSTDGAVAFQWAKTLAPGQSMTITTAYTISAPVPEPATYGLMALGGLFVGAVARRRAQRNNPQPSRGV
jgi:PEP-CTERM motif